MTGPAAGERAGAVLTAGARLRGDDDALSLLPGHADQRAVASQPAGITAQLLSEWLGPGAPCPRLPGSARCCWRRGAAAARRVIRGAGRSGGRNRG
jgi:hypothetical protein